MRTLLLTAAAALLLGGAAQAQEPGKPKDNRQLPAPKEVVMQGNGGVYFATREWHAGNRYLGYGPFPGYGGGYYAPFYQGYYPGYGMGYFGYDWSPARMRITEINVSAGPPAVPGAGAPVRVGDTTSRGLVLAVKEAGAKNFTDDQGRRWTLVSGKDLAGQPKALSGFMLQGGEGGLPMFFTTAGQLFRMEAADQKEKEKGKG